MLDLLAQTTQPLDVVTSVESFYHHQIWTVTLAVGALVGLVGIGLPVTIYLLQRGSFLDTKSELTSAMAKIRKDANAAIADLKTQAEQERKALKGDLSVIHIHIGSAMLRLNRPVLALGEYLRAWLLEVELNENISLVISCVKQSCQAVLVRDSEALLEQEETLDELISESRSKGLLQEDQCKTDVSEIRAILDEAHKRIEKQGEASEET